MESIRDIFSRTNNTDINYIEYSIYFPPSASEKATCQALCDYERQIESLIEPFLRRHLWQKDKFKLRIARNDQKDPSFPFLFGFSRFGDCLNDEWFIVFLLYQISHHFEDALIAVSDNDGDLLLIEAALALPEWLDPSNSDNRVYIYQGKLHIIPLPKSPADIFNFMSSGGTTATKNALSRLESIEIIRQQQLSGMSTIASEDIQCIIEDKLKKYHQQPQVSHEVHHARTVLLNPKAAFVLLSVPQLLPLAVEAFYLRDPMSLKACATMHHFPPQSTIHNRFDTVLPWTQTTFAQTLHQQFYAPKPFHLPAKQHESYQATELGMKLMCGLEMLYVKDFSVHTNNNTNGEDDEAGTDQIDAYDLMEMAPTSLESVTPRQKMDELLATYSLPALEKLIKASNAQNTEDDTAWLNVYPDELESILAQRMDVSDSNGPVESTNNDFTRSEGNDLGSDVHINLEEMMTKFEHFLEHSSSNVDGVKINDVDNSSEDEDSEDEDTEDAQDLGQGGREAEDDMLKQISFDFTSFMDILKHGIDEQSATRTSDDYDDTKDLKALMDEMDKEIIGHEKVGESFVKSKPPPAAATEVCNEERTQANEEKEDAPVDIQLNLIQNILESFKGQQGLPGPTGNLLRQFGIALPLDSNDDGPDEDDVVDNTSRKP